MYRVEWRNGEHLVHIHTTLEVVSGGPKHTGTVNLPEVTRYLVGIARTVANADIADITFDGPRRRSDGSMGTTVTFSIYRRGAHLVDVAQSAHELAAFLSEIHEQQQRERVWAYD